MLLALLESFCFSKPFNLFFNLFFLLFFSNLCSLFQKVLLCVGLHLGQIQLDLPVGTNISSHFLHGLCSFPFLIILIRTPKTEGDIKLPQQNGGLNEVRNPFPLCLVLDEDYCLFSF